MNGLNGPVNQSKYSSNCGADVHMKRNFPIYNEIITGQIVDGIKNRNQ